jgi:4-hydroxy-3-polyprenylbenzoate decarboxylase
MSGPERITLAMTGASGAQYGLRLLDCLIQEDREVHFLISKAAQLVMATETDVVLPAKPQAMQAFLSEYTGAAAGQIRVFAKEDWRRHRPPAPAHRPRWWWCPVPPARCRQSPPAPATT